MTTILLTGAAGTLGRELTARWRNETHRPQLLTLDRRAHESGFPQLTANAGGPFGPTGRAGLREVTHLIHLAGTVTTGPAPADGRWTSLTTPADELLALMDQLPQLRHVTFASSYMVYATPVLSPLDEHHEQRASNAYAWEKSAVEYVLAARDVAGCSLRLTGVYGPGVGLEANRMLMVVMRAALEGTSLALNGPDSLRNHLYIDDAVAALRRACEEEWNGVLNISGPEAVSTRQAVDLIASVSGADLDVTWDLVTPAGDAVVDATTVWERYGFRAGVTMREGLDAYHRWLTGDTESVPSMRGGQR